MEFLQEQHWGKFYSSCSSQRHEEHEYAPVTLPGFQIIIKRFIATESGSGTDLSVSMPDGNIVYLEVGFFSVLNFLPTIR